MNRLDNKIAIVTGSTSGIGRAAAELFAAEGATVVLTGRRAELGEEIVAGIEDKGGKAVFKKVDVRSIDNLQALVDYTIEQYGRIDILVNNAGYDRETPFLEIEEWLYEQMFNTNFRPYFFLCQMVIPHMLKAGKGSIVNTASIAAEVGLPLHTIYSATKGAVKQFTKSLAGEFATSGIRVNAVFPGLTFTGMVPKEFAEKAVCHVPMGRAAQPQEIAQGILFFASDESSFCTGAMLAVDGGETSL